MENEGLFSPFAQRQFGVLVEGKMLFVSRETLAMASPKLKRILYDGNTKNFVELLDAKLNEIHEVFLCVISVPVKKFADDKNVEILLKYANEYELEELKLSCEKFLRKQLDNLEIGDEFAIKILQLACKYKLNNLLTRCISHVAALDDINEIKKDDDGIFCQVILAIYESRNRRHRLDRHVKSSNHPGVETCIVCDNEIFTCTNCSRSKCVGYHAEGCPEKEKFSSIKDPPLCFCALQNSFEFKTVPEPIIEECDFFKNSEERNHRLSVENEILWIFKDALVMMSPVFEAMFYGKFKESRENIVELNGKKLKDILELCRCLFSAPVRKQIYDDNVDLLMILSDEYDIKELAVRCQDFLSERIKKLFFQYENLEVGDKQVLEIIGASSKICSELIPKCIPFVAALSDLCLENWKSELLLEIMAEIYEAKCNRYQAENSSINVHNWIENDTFKKCGKCSVKSTKRICAICFSVECETCNARSLCEKCLEFHQANCPHKAEIIRNDGSAACTCGFTFENVFFDAL